MPIAIIPDDIDRDDDNRQLIARLNANSRMELLCDLFPRHPITGRLGTRHP